MKKIILLAHGSPDPRSGLAMRGFAAKVQKRLKISTDIAFLDHEKPTLSDVANGHQDEKILVVPMLLSNAFHARFDVPQAMADAGLSQVLPPIGHPFDLLTALIRDAGSNALVVAAGSSNAGARQIFQDTVRLASIRSGVCAEPAYVSGAHLNVKDQLPRMQEKAVGKATVIPWLLAEGRLLDVVLAESQSNGALVQGSGLVNEAKFLGYIASSIQSADFCDLSLVNS